MTDQPGGACSAPVWPGPPVICTVCVSACMPTFKATDDEAGWRMPDHPMPMTGGYGETCPGSGAPCVKPVHQTMAKRIEDHVVAAMPPEHQTIPDAKGLTEADPMKGPGQ